ncbi:hypothetical protein XPA_003590 [Xanthoria parietina]
MAEHDSFYRHVRDKASELRGQIDELKTTTLDATVRDAAATQCLTGINDLTFDIRNHAHDSASHDQRIYNETIKGLNDQLQKFRSEIAPRRKFAFTSVPKTIPTAFSSTVLEGAPVADGSNQSSEQSPQVFGPKPAGTSSSPTSSSFTNICNTLCLVPSPNHANGGVVLADSSRCVIKCSVPSRSLTTTNVHNSVVVAGPINGAAHVTRLANSVLIVSCRQLRMHDCRNCDVYLECSSNPIIEHCSEMRFAPLQDFLGLGVPEGSQTNMWDQVNDFNWLKAGHSPNWSVLSLARRFEPDRWTIIQSLTEGDPVDTVLEAFDIS